MYMTCCTLQMNPIHLIVQSTYITCLNTLWSKGSMGGTRLHFLLIRRPFFISEERMVGWRLAGEVGYDYDEKRSQKPEKLKTAKTAK